MSKPVALDGYVVGPVSGGGGGGGGVVVVVVGESRRCTLPRADVTGCRAAASGTVVGGTAGTGGGGKVGVDGRVAPAASPRGVEEGTAWSTFGPGAATAAADPSTSVKATTAPAATPLLPTSSPLSASAAGAHYARSAPIGRALLVERLPTSPNRSSTTPNGHEQNILNDLERLLGVRDPQPGRCLRNWAAMG